MKYQVWSCKIGIKGAVTLPNGADYPMRQAAAQAFKEITGVDCEFIFSGWAGELTDGERRVIEGDQ